MSALMSGVFNNKPPQPRYSFIWDVKIVLYHIKKFWRQNDSILNKQLTYKVSMLLALTSASRAYGIHNLDISHMGRLDDQYTFTYAKLHKGWRKGQPSPSITFYSFAEDQDLCVVKALDEYLTRTKGWRQVQKRQLLLGTIKPHVEVSSSTVSRWIKETLKLCGVDTIGNFNAHSTRSASTSKAAQSGLSYILSMGSWSNKSTWQKFYCREIISSGKKIQNRIFKKGKT